MTERVHYSTFTTRGSLAQLLCHFCKAKVEEENILVADSFCLNYLKVINILD